MKCQGTVIYKGIEERSAGVFHNDKGQEINYDSSYIVKFDEIENGKINEKKLKFSTKNSTLFDKFKKFEPYTKVNLVCDVTISNNICRLIPIDVQEIVTNED